LVVDGFGSRKGTRKWFQRRPECFWILNISLPITEVMGTIVPKTSVMGTVMLLGRRGVEGLSPKESALAEALLTEALFTSTELFWI